MHPYAVPHFFREVVPGRLELPTSTLSVWRSNQLSYRTMSTAIVKSSLFYNTFYCHARLLFLYILNTEVREYKKILGKTFPFLFSCQATLIRHLQKGGVPAAPSGTATLLRLSPNYQFRSRPTLAVTDFKRPRLSWLDGRCVQGPGTYSPRHG